MGSGGGSSKTVVNNDPWKGQQGYLKDIYSQAAGLYGQGAGYNPYPGQTVAGMTPMQNQGIDAAYSNIVNGATPTKAASDMLTTTLKGGAQNPYLDDLFNTSAQAVTDQFNRGILPGIKTQGIQSGMYDSSRRGIAEGVAAGEAQKNLASLAANIYGSGYESERARQMQAAGLSPTLSNYDQQQLINLGALDQNQLQQELNAMQNYWNSFQNAPWQRLGAYSQEVMSGGSPGGASTTSTSSGSGGFSGLGLLGGAGTGAAIGGALPTDFMTANPYMWPVLIGGGGLLGGFS